MKEIQLSQQGKNKGKYVALVDDEDFEYLNQWKWSVTIVDNCYYAIRAVWINGKQIRHKMHCDIMGNKWIDHIDGNGLNNQRLNLRFCNTSQNMMNMRPRKYGSSIYKGVSWNTRSKKWKAQILTEKKRIQLGVFNDEVEAARIYDKAAKRYFKEFAWLNFP